MTTIRDVAHLAAVSIATVSRVVNNSPHKVHQSTRENVLKAIKELDYRPNALARGLLNKKTMTIGIIIPDISNTYYAEIVRGIQDVADTAGYAVILQNTDRNQDRIVKHIYLLREKLADGIIFGGGIIQGDEPLSALGELRDRAVVIGRHEVNFPAIRVDNIGGADAVTRHLIDLGHRRIAFIGGPPVSTTIVDRLTGYTNALVQNGLVADSQMVMYGNFTPESGCRVTKELFARKEKPTAILSANDQMSFGAFKAVRELGLKIPKDVAIAGFDDIPLSSYFDPPLTSVAIPRYALGTAAMELLVDLIAGGTVDKIRWFKTELNIRESTAG
jgi:LacI family transcriptional regulator